MTDSDQPGSDQPGAVPTGGNSTGGSSPTGGDPSAAGNNGSLPPTPPPLPPQAADEGPRPVPANADEALDIGRRHFPEVGSPDGPASLHVHEFDLGYLVHAGWPAPEDPTAPPASPGGSNVVINKENGDVTFLPNFPPAEIEDLYRRVYRPSSEA
ncbi:hypothetical protein HEK616_09280 [Streptomyces nigrescens]|uniref:Uncharacterized protein n=1 Tax=Streptomyces nigrescens TaxID=1920 RepID=A0ABN6QNU9_STRNI|nr:hypothetical protein [Streptomyces nigrescens]BDM67441.1 hypothetical protein HEK616_09280 [Streptomyces nigrescens]